MTMSMRRPGARRAGGAGRGSSTSHQNSKPSITMLQFITRYSRQSSIALKWIGESSQK